MRRKACMVGCWPSVYPHIMGIPFFFRWLVERYPACVRPVGQACLSVPPVDNLYLDMNGIVHNSTHASPTSNQSTQSCMWSWPLSHLRYTL